jgi:hypothetical protein
MLARTGAVTLDSNTLTTSTCVSGTSTLTTPGRTATSRFFTALVKGTHIARVRFALDGKLIKIDRTSPFSAPIHVVPGVHQLSTITYYTDLGPPKVARLRFSVTTPAQPAARPRVTG